MLRQSPFRFLFRTILPCFVVVCLTALLFCDRWIERRSSSLHYNELADLPPADVGLVLGCSQYLSNGRTNLYFQHRIETAANAFFSGKCRYLIVSGDNGSFSYNEPRLMKRALVKAGIPESRIVCDFAGFRTLDSVVRASKVFGQRELLVISQQFHNERAIYIAQHFGIKLTGLNAPDVWQHAGWRTRTREKFARVKTILDLHVFGVQPRFLGEPIEIDTLKG
tara:strand:- start:1848 stop:2516 length:669 start_codon:yes stop_codon:yes gene_type:complete